MEPGLALQEFLEFVIGHLVDDPSQASVLHEMKGNHHLYRVRVAQADIGKIIGRNGYTISAIRSLFGAAVKKHGIKASLKIDEG